HPVEGLIPPGRFIALAEQSGHIVPIGAWALQTACRQARQWLDTYGDGLMVAVNLSAVQFADGNLFNTVTEALTRSGLPSSLLELELTESVLLHEGTIEVIRKLQRIGVTFSIDDFGTGYSSLAYLKKLSVDKLKIDRSFVDDMLDAPDSASIVNAVIQLGHGLNLTVIAEGVETEAQLAFLRSAGCDEAQGYLISKPIPASAFQDLLADARSWDVRGDTVRVPPGSGAHSASSGT
ncbi:EAL domain-containing protein, partial [Duganella sp. FT3S]